jgi:hypothetical protein
MADNYEIVLALAEALSIENKNKLFAELQSTHRKIKNSLSPSVHLPHQCSMCRSERDYVVCDGCLRKICNYGETNLHVFECTLCDKEYFVCEDTDCYKSIATYWACDCLNDYPYPCICVECSLKTNAPSFACAECGTATLNSLYQV